MTVKKHTIIFGILVYLCHHYLLAVNDTNILQANRVEGKPVIDGKIEEEIWQQQANFYNGYFTQNQPANGIPSSQRTELIIIYNNQSIYIAAKLFDDHPDKIARQFSARDDNGVNADIFGIALDTYNNQQNAFLFTVSTAGVQMDCYITPENTDCNWNAVWKSAVSLEEDGWSVEMELPYSALRFPKREVQTWGINFVRRIRRTGERTFWHPVDAAVTGFVNQFGVLEGIQGVKPPVRLSATPYMTTYAIRDDVNQANGFSWNGGVDIKYGINEGFTLDMSLIPDFGQVQSDNVVLNLSPFEVQFSENRPFFTEGTELFNKADGELFYSRRIGTSFGKVALGEEEEWTKKVTEAPLINAIKVSGRNKKGMGIGFFNAVTNETRGRIRNKETLEEREVLVDPVTNFNVLVIDQNLKNNSNISVINTNVSRFGGSDANVTGTELRLNNKKNTWYFQGFGAVSQKSGEEETVHNKQGYKYYIGGGKISGKYRIWGERKVESKHYNPNDLGFLRRANTVAHEVEFSYRQFQPKGKLVRYSYFLGGWHEQLETPLRYAETGLWTEFRATMKSLWEFKMFATVSPGDSYDYFEPRTEGRYFKKATWQRARLWLYSDRRKKLFFEMNAGVWQRPAFAQFDNWVEVYPTWRITDKFSMEYGMEIAWRRKEWGYATKEQEGEVLQHIIFGQRNVKNITNVLTLSYAFNSKMNINGRVRYYWSNVKYMDFKNLEQNGELTESIYTGLDGEGVPQHDNNFNALNVDMVYVWQFAPGSEMRVVWKDAIQNSIHQTHHSFGRNLQRTLQASQTNSFSVRLLYFLDYLYLKKKG